MPKDAPPNGGAMLERLVPAGIGDADQAALLGGGRSGSPVR
jgi:hypothetical protein